MVVNDTKLFLGVVPGRTLQMPVPCRAVPEAPTTVLRSPWMCPVSGPWLAGLPNVRFPDLGAEL